MSKPDCTVVTLSKSGMRFALDQALTSETMLARAVGEVSDSSHAHSRDN